jgi:hypothetical protein
MMNVVRAAILMLALAVCAQAGDGIIQNGSPAASPTPPPPPSSNMTQDEPETEVSAEGIIQNDLTAAASQAALDVLQSFLTLF